MRNLWLITKEDFKNLILNPMWIFYSLGFPILMMLILGFLTQDSYGAEISSYDYYGITIMIYFLFNSGMTSANAFMEERIKKPNMRIIYSPGAIADIYLSKIISSTLFTSLFYAIDMLFFGFVIHVDFGPIGHIAVLFLLYNLVAVTMGIMFCCIFKTEEITNQLQSVVVNLLCILGGVLFSLDGYGTMVRRISDVSPVKWLVKGCFQMIYDQDYHLFFPLIVGGILAVIVMMLICRFTFHKEDCIC